MEEGTRTALLEKGGLDEESVKRALAAASEAAPDDRVRTGLEVVIADAETDPATARSILMELRGDHSALLRIESWLGRESSRTGFGLGAAITLAELELARDEPDLHALLPQILAWLEGEW